MKKYSFITAFMVAILFCSAAVIPMNERKAAKGGSLEVSFRYQRQDGPGSNQYAV